MENNNNNNNKDKNKNSSNSLVFGRWLQTKIWDKSLRPSSARISYIYFVKRVENYTIGANTHHMLQLVLSKTYF